MSVGRTFGDAPPGRTDRRLRSSTITTVFAIGLVSGGMPTFTQSLGVVLGANVGTTFTAQVIAFDTSLLGMAMLFCGYVLSRLAREGTWRLVGTVVLGLGPVFLGMELMGEAVRPLRTFEPFLAAMESLSSPLLGVLVGAAFTTLVLGALVWLFFIDVLVDAAVALSPSHPQLSGLERRAAETPRQFAMAHTVFTPSTALVLIWFLGPIGRLIERLVPDRAPAPQPEASEPDPSQPPAAEPVQA